MRKIILVLLCLLSLVAAWLLWPSASRLMPAAKNAAPASAASVVVAAPAFTNLLSLADVVVTRSAASTNRETYRLTNTQKTVGELTVMPHAILLENAMIDTAAKVALKIPAHLRAKAEPGAYIVQARGLVDAPFRAALAGAGAQIISYIPNNAYLVQLSSVGAAVLSDNALVQAVLPFEPYFKLQSSLLGLAVNDKALPPAQVLTLGLYAAGADATVAQIQGMGGAILATDRSPFGPVVRVRPPADWISLAQLPGVQRVEPATRRVVANDLARATMGISVDTVTNANWLGLSGSNVLVEVNDTGIDTNQPDLMQSSGTGPTRVLFGFPDSGYDTDGHGTHVAGIIAGNGFESTTVTNARGSIMPGTNFQFRGKAPAAKLFSVGFLGANDTNVYVSDQYLQEMPALTNALISNNSWVNSGVNEYDLSAASYDAAVRDAVPEMTGPQPVLFVFAAGNDGGGSDNGGGGSSDTILSPGTAKNVITVGALEQFRDITNIVTALDGTSNAIWQGETSSGSRVAAFSARGNVGVQTEGTFGRFKPDVVAPGVFVVSTRSTTWDQAAYYNPTNYHNEFSSYGLLVDTNVLAYGGASVPINAVSVTITVTPNSLSPFPFPVLPFCLSTFNGSPDPATPSTYDLLSSNNVIAIPPDSGGAVAGIASLLNSGFTIAVADSTNFPVNFDLIIQIITTNDLGNQLTVLSNLNNTLGPWYYYETGTSMAAPAVSGALALMQDFFTNTLHATPSPALLKAMLINGARLSSGYNFYGVTNSINYEGWGLVNVPNSIPLALTNTVPGVSNTVPMFFSDQSPTNVLATGDSRTFNVSVPTAAARAQMMHITLAWTDPPGNPVAGIKLVNNLDLIVTNLATGQVYYGNNLLAASVPFSVANSNAVPDAINNVETVVLPTTLATNYSVTVLGRNVTVNAVTAEQTNIVQDYALVISCGNGANTNGISVTEAAANVASLAQQVTFTTPTNQIYFNQIAGANAPWLSTNAVLFSTNSVYATNASLFIGQTNQWHFFVVTNTTAFTNAAFIVFLPNTLATPRMGVFETSTANSTRPEADLDLFVASAPDANAASLTNLNPVVISNCIAGVNGDAAALSRGGTEFVAYNNAQPNQVYYVGVQCEDQMAGQFGFLPIFSQSPFSQLDTNGNQIVNGLLLPANIPDGDNAHPGRAYVFGLATIPMTVGGLTVTNTIAHQNYGDLVGVLTHNTAYSVLNNHDGLTDPIVTQVYNDDGLPGTVHTDGPGSLRNFRGNQAIGPWILTEIDDSLTMTGSVTGLTLVIRPHQDLRKQPFTTVTVPPGSWFFDYVDVPVGYTNITVVATNLPPNSTPPIQLYLNYQVEPDFTNYLGFVLLTNGVPPGNEISYGPPLAPGRYFVGIFNPDVVAHDILLGVELAFNAAAISTVDFAASGPVPLLDDAVTYATITNYDQADLIQGINVGLRVDHPRISDLVFHLISPDGTRYLLMENRGGQSTNGCGATIITTNVFSATANGTALPNTNFINTGSASGTFPITYNFYTAPDEMDVYYGTSITPSNLIYSTGVTNNPSAGGGGPQNTIPVTINVPFGPTNGLVSTYLTIVMDQQPNPLLPTNRPDFWTYTAGSVVTNYAYLAFTEDTNLTQTPIKFAPPPFVPQTVFNSVLTDSFEAYAPGIYSPGAGFGGWNIATNKVGIVTAPPAFDGVNLLQLHNGVVFTNVPTVSGQKYVLTYELGSSVTEDSNGVVVTATNANWQVKTFPFTATATNTPLVLAASADVLAGLTFTNAQTFTFDTNALLDDFVLTPAAGNLYYQAEQDLSPLIDTSPYGEWQLEILDNRAGATNNATLLSWQLEFTFANTNFTIPITTITNSGPQTNSLPGGAIAWYLIDVPTNADFATNALLFATLPLNLWFSTNVPPTITNSPADVELLAGSTGGSALLGTNGSPVNVPYAPAYIVPGGSYYLGVQNPNIIVANYAIDVTFHLLPAAPSLITLPATNVIDIAATLDASVDPNGLPTAVYFEYGLDTNYGYLSVPLLLTNNLTTWTFVGIGVTNLLPGAVYHFQAVGTNSLGTNYGGDLTFTNLADAPFVLTEPATNITATTATLDALVNPDGAATTLYFEYSLTTNSWTNFSASISLTNNLNSTNYWGIGVSNLTPASVYYFQAIATNSTGTNYGGILTFTNPPAGPLPFAFTAPATLLTGSSAQLNGFATPSGSAAAAWFEWGASVGYGVTTPAVSLGTNYNVIFVTNQISELITNVPYHYRLVVSNAVGVTYGFDQIFDQANVVVWGADFIGQTVPVPPGLTNLVVGIGAGYDFSLAVNNDGTVVVWGDDSFNQTNVPAGLTNAVAVSGGEKHSLALKSDRTVLVWGSHQFNQTNVPASLTNAVAASSGGYHCVALRDDGNVTAWGLNNSGQTNVPAGLSNVVAVAGGDLHTVALKNDGTVVAWGYNGDGETNVPAGLSNVVAIAAGEYHALALKSDGTVAAWGYNADGEINVPASATNVIAVAGGGFHSLALRGDGTVVVWGDNGSGQWNYPTNMSNVVAIAAGGFHSLALSSVFGLNQTNNAPFWTNNLANSTVTMNEMTTLLVTNTATDTNIPTQTLTYTLLNSPTWAGINNQGVITLSPLEPDGPGTNTITTVVTDNGHPNLSATNSFILIVNEVNTPPFWPTNVPSQTNYIVNELTLLTVTNTASDSDIPTNGLTYTLFVAALDTNAPAVTNAVILTNGIISWTPTEAQGPGTYVFTTVVTDTNPPAVNATSLSATNNFTVTVNEVNSAPFWTNSFPTVTMNELTTNTMVATAQDADFPTNTLTYALTNSPAWALINTNSGVITLTPQEVDGPGTNTITVIVTDNGVPPLSATTNFTVVVNEVNTAPVFLGTPTNRVVDALTPVVVTNAATDSDIPANTLFYTLVNPPSGMAVGFLTGVITWTPALGQADTTNIVITVVTDNGVPSLSATNSFTIIVNQTNAVNYLVSHWPLNESNGVVTHDIGPAHNDGTLTNVGAGIIGWTTGIEGSAVVLTNGAFTTVSNGGFVTVGNAASLNFEATNKFSISAWMKTPAGLSQDVTVAGKMVQPTVPGGNYYGYELHYRTGTGILIWLINTFQGNPATNHAIQVSSDDVPVNDGGWHQVAFTYDGSGLAAGVTIYIDGVSRTNVVFDDTLGTTNTIQNNVSFNIGSRDDGAFHNFTGSIDDVQVYNTVLSSNDLVTIYGNPGSAIYPVVPPSNFNASAGTNGFGLQWSAPVYEAFQVQWTTNLMPVINWSTLPNIVTSTNGTFLFTDTNLPSVMKFYQLILLP